jgi:DNA helicase-2/ATP-dependent DNA helicase PcrA
MREILLGPPGTGKTTSLLDILDNELAAGTDPARIGFVSFTRRAAEEAISRACSRFKFERSQFPHFRTLHSLCYRQLGLRSGDVLEGKKFFEFAQWAGIKVTGRSWSDDGMITGFDYGDRMLFMENLARIREVPLKTLHLEADDGIRWPDLERAEKCLIQYKAAHGLMDYTDMLTEFARSSIRVNLDVLLLDEVQDFSRLQWRVADKLGETARRVVAAGDDDQAIYHWAGADVEHLINLEGSARVLGQSWRCPPVIQKLSNTIIKHVKHRRPKSWAPRAGKNGLMGKVANFGEADISQEWDAGDEAHERPPVLVLARNAYLLREQVEPTLRAQGIVFERNGKSSINVAALVAAETWTRLQRAREPVRLDEARSMYSFMTTRTGVRHGYKTLSQMGDESDRPVTMRDLIDEGGLLMDPKVPWHEALERMPTDDVAYMQAARRRGEKLRARPRVRVSTIHSAKGGEASHVVLMTEMARRTHQEMQKNVDDERRVWYVGVTRARDRLTLVNPETAQYCPWV